MMSCHSKVNNPNHYQLESGKQAIDIIRDALGKKGYDNFCKGNVIKYVIRCDNKNGIEDLKKAVKYIEFMIENRNEQDEH